MQPKQQDTGTDHQDRQDAGEPASEPETLGAPLPGDEQQDGAAERDETHAGHEHAGHVHDEHCNHDHGPAPQYLERATIKKQRSQSKRKRKQQKASRKRNR